MKGMEEMMIWSLVDTNCVFPRSLFFVTGLLERLFISHSPLVAFTTPSQGLCCMFLSLGCFTITFMSPCHPYYNFACRSQPPHPQCIPFPSPFSFFRFSLSSIHHTLPLSIVSFPLQFFLYLSPSSHNHHNYITVHTHQGLVCYIPFHTIIYILIISPTNPRCAVCLIHPSFAIPLSLS